MRFGLAFASGIGSDGPSSVEVAKVAEEAGFDSVWGGEHVIWPSTVESPYPYSADGEAPAGPDTYIPDPLIWLAYVSAAAPSLRLGTCILILPQRNPLVLAKEIATLDHLTGGKVELGIGVGWMKEEFDALGVPWERRGRRNDEYVEAMRALWGGPAAEYHGEFVDFEPVTCSPRPPQGAELPILVGGDTDVAIRRAARLADGYFPGESSIGRLSELIARLRAECEAQERDPAEVEINAMFIEQLGDPLAGAEQLVEAGVHRAMLPAFFFAGPGGLDRLREFGENVIAKV